MWSIMQDVIRWESLASLTHIDIFNRHVKVDLHGDLNALRDALGGGPNVVERLSLHLVSCMNWLMTRSSEKENRMYVPSQ